jgi:hypothetical protein
MTALLWNWSSHEYIPNCNAEAIANLTKAGRTSLDDVRVTHVEGERVEWTGLHRNREEAVRKELRGLGVDADATFGGVAFNSWPPAARTGPDEAAEAVDRARRLVGECLCESQLFSSRGFRPHSLSVFHDACRQKIHS